MPRRKKKPFYRPRNILLALALLCGLAVCREIYIAMTAVPGTSVDYPAKVAALIEASQPKDVPPDSPNAVEVLDRAIALEATVQSDARSKSTLPQGQFPIDYSLVRGPVSPKGYAPGVFEAIRANSIQALDDLRKTEFYSLLAQAAQTRRAVRPTPASGNLISFLLPNLGRYRNLARLNGARMYLAHQAGDDAELVRAYEETLALGRITGHGTFLIDYLVAIAIDALAMSELREELVERAPPEATLVELLAAMDRQKVPSISNIIEGERLSVMDTIQWTHTDDGRGSGRLITSKVAEITAMWGSGGSWMNDLGSWRIMNLGGAAFPSKAANVRRADELFDMIRAALERPYYQRAAAHTKIDDYFEAIPARYVLLRIILPSWGRSLQSADQHQMTWEGTRVHLAVEIYRARHGHYPNSLAEIGPDIISPMPIDPYTGKPFGYRKLAEPDEHGRAFILYSAGADSTDNQGQMGKHNHDAFRLPAGKGFDYIINEPREQPEPEEPPKSEPGPEPQPPPDSPEPARSADSAV